MGRCRARSRARTRFVEAALDREGKSESAGAAIFAAVRRRLPLALLALLLLAVDLVTPSGWSTALLYGALVPASLRLPHRADTLGAAFGATLLVLVGQAASAAGDVDGLAATHRLLALCAIWTATILCLWQRDQAPPRRRSPAARPPGRPATPIAELEAEPYAIDPARLRVLVAVKEPEERRLIDFVLRGAGFAVELAGSSPVALRRVHEAEARDEAVDLLLLDLDLPEGAGASVVSQLRAEGRELAILALGTRAGDEARTRTLAAGCDGLLPRPLERRVLVAAIIGQLEDAKRRRTLARSGAAPRPGPASRAPARPGGLPPPRSWTGEGGSVGAGLREREAE